VIALYPSIPIEKALECVREKLKNDDTLADRTDWRVDDIIQLLSICLETHFKTIDGRIFTQIDGTPIGKSISGPLADIYMIWFEEQHIFNENNEFRPFIKSWKRFRDDIHVIWSGGNEELDRFFWQLNYKEQRIQFTIERESNYTLPFLDMSIKRAADKLITKVYRKDTHTQKYIHWRSNCSKNCKLGILKGLIHRAHLLCDLKEDLLSELNLLKDVFISNGYPSKLVERTMNNSWKEELEKQLKALIREQNEENMYAEQEEEKSSYYDTLHVPYIAGLSEQLAKDLKVINVGVTFQRGRTVFDSICKLKPSSHRDDKKNLIYCLGCKCCDQIYLGETQQFFSSRKYQHEYAIKCKQSTNGLAQHLKQNKKHMIDWENRVFLDFEPHWRKRKIKEAIFIDCLNPGNTISPNILMNLEKGIEIASCWKEFNPQIKKLLSKKIPREKPTEKENSNLQNESTRAVHL